VSGINSVPIISDSAEQFLYTLSQI